MVSLPSNPPQPAESSPLLAGAAPRAWRRRLAAASAAAACVGAAAALRQPAASPRLMRIQDDNFVARYGNVDCDLSDDDGLNWGVDRCWGDSEQCAKYHPTIISNACAAACAGDPDGAVATWFEVCNWQAVNALPETCAGTFAPSADALAAPSRNAAPVNEGVAVSRTFSTYNVALRAPGGGSHAWDGCEAHAFCKTAVLADGSFASEYARAVLDYYAWAEEPQMALDYLWATADAWCAPDVLASIADGSFDPSEARAAFDPARRAPS